MFTILTLYNPIHQGITEAMKVPKAPIINVRYCFPPIFVWDDSRRNDQSATDQKFINALEMNDVVIIGEMLNTNEITLDHRICDEPILVMILRSLSLELIDLAAQYRPDFFVGRSARDHSDQRSPFNVLLFRLGKSIQWGWWCKAHWKSEVYCESCGNYAQHMRAIDYLIDLNRRSSVEDLFELVFNKADIGQSAFNQAIDMKLDEVIVKFLDLITAENRELLREDWFIDNKWWDQGTFSYIEGLPTSLVKMIIDRLPFSRSLLNTKQTSSSCPPIVKLAASKRRFAVELVRTLVVHGGADIDSTNYQQATPLLVAVENGNWRMMETLLRLGARTDLKERNGHTVLSMLLFGQGGAAQHSIEQRTKMVELLLAFGVDLSKEPYLHRPTHLPRIDSVTPGNLLVALCVLRTSGFTNSLVRLCRKSIRHHLNHVADERMNQLTMIPNGLKAYLLAKNERPVLGYWF